MRAARPTAAAERPTAADGRLPVGHSLTWGNGARHRVGERHQFGAVGDLHGADVRVCLSSSHTEIPPTPGRRDNAAMANQRWVAEVGAANAEWLATESRTARLAREYRPFDIGEGRIEYSPRALGAARELGEEEDGFLTEDGEGLRVWIGDDAFDLDLIEG